MFIQTLPQLALQIWRLSKGNRPNKPAVQVILESIWTVSLKAHDWSSWVQFLLKNCEILHSVRGLYDKYSAS